MIDYKKATEDLKEFIEWAPTQLTRKGLYIKTSKEMLEDSRFISEYIENRLTKGLQLESRKLERIFFESRKPENL